MISRSAYTLNLNLTFGQSTILEQHEDNQNRIVKAEAGRDEAERKVRPCFVIRDSFFAWTIDSYASQCVNVERTLDTCTYNCWSRYRVQCTSFCVTSTVLVRHCHRL